MTLITNYLSTIFIGALSMSVNAANEKKHHQKNLRTNNRNLQGCSADNIQTASSVVVDGQMNEWDLSNDFHKTMYNGGELNPVEPIFQRVGTAFFKYDCDTSRLCVLALADSFFVLEPVGDGSNAWLKDYDINRDIRIPLQQKDVWMNDEVVGWEACYTLDPGCHERIEVHAGWGESPDTIDNKVASTGKISVDRSYLISLNLQCGPSTPAPSPAPTPGIINDEVCIPNSECSTYTVPDNMDAVCTKGFCNDNGVCEPVAKVRESCGRENLFGDCDAGSICSSTGTCEARYKSASDMCSSSKGCCDRAEYCTGDSYACPQDVKKSVGTVCRDSCASCVNDPAEVCDGMSDTCPNNVILTESVCIYAGQDQDAGSVTFTASEQSHNEHQLCVEMKLDNGWKLDSDSDEPIQVEIAMDGTPFTIPRRFRYNMSSSETVMLANGNYKLCISTVPSAETNFAINFDVMKDNQRATAWALPCKDSTAESALEANSFMGRGWGEYFTWTPCNLDTCPTQDCTFER